MNPEIARQRMRLEDKNSTSVTDETKGNQNNDIIEEETPDTTWQYSLKRNLLNPEKEGNTESLNRAPSREMGGSTALGFFLQMSV